MGSTVIHPGKGSESPEGGRGGNVSLTGGPPPDTAKDGRIFLRSAHGDEWMRFDPDGSVFVKGEKVDTSRLVYVAFLGWLAECVGLAEPGAFPSQDQK